jgi:acyl-CoA synthetase (AMP-forming)/AMP-acid ligase II
MGEFQLSISELLASRAGVTPRRTALIDVHSGRRLTFDDFLDQSRRTASALRARGVGKGDRVGILAMNCPEFLITFFAAAHIGAVVVPINWRLVPDELEYILNDSGTSLVVFGSDFVSETTDLQRRPGLRGVRHWLMLGDQALRPEFADDFEVAVSESTAVEFDDSIGGDDLMFIMYTSGTTGRPKGAVHTHATTFFGQASMAATCDYRDRDNYLNSMPMFHVSGLLTSLISVYRGMTNVIVRAFDPQVTWDLVEEYDIATFFMAPQMIAVMKGLRDPERHKHSHLRFVITGAAPVPESLILDYQALGIEIHQGYGLTEGFSCTILLADDGARKVGSAGLPYQQVKVRIVREDGTDCDPNEVGEIVTRSAQMMKGYWNLPKETSEAIRDGWLHTGDLALFDDDGFIYIKDRLKDMIISGGENVYPAEIENVIVSHADVVEVAVIGVASERWGESPLAIVVSSNPALTEAEVLAHCDGRLARYKRPVGVEFVTALPRNASAKVLKPQLREQFRDRRVP